MKKLLLTFVCLSAILFSPMVGMAQEKPAWGGDVNVNPVPGQFYKNVCVTVGYDGTIYLGRLYAESANGPYQNWEVLKSTDNGVTFTEFKASFVNAENKYTAFDLVAAGENAADFRLYVARPYMDTVTKMAYMRATMYTSSGTSTGVSFDNESYTSYSSSRAFDYICWATDSKNPAPSSAPYTISLVSNKAGSYDSLIVWTSAEGGSNFIRRALEGSFNYIKDVSVAVGVNEGVSIYPRLGISYEVQTSILDTTGDIFVRYIYGDDATNLSYPGPFQVGVPGVAYAKPTIALSQTLGTGTGPGYDDFRTIISYQTISTGLDVNYRLTDNLYTAEPDFTALGVEIGAGAGNQMNPHLQYDPLFNNFLITYFDQKTGKLPYKIKGLNTGATVKFTSLKSSYRDVTTATSTPIQPRVAMNAHTSTAVFAWNDNQKSMFDAENSTVGIASQPLHINELKAWPNPATDQISLSLQSEKTTQADICIIDVSGRVLRRQTEQVQQGNNDFRMDLRGLSAGQYIISIQGSVINGRTMITVK